MAELTVIIPQYRNWQETISCCSSLLRFRRGGLKLIVVDDGSPAEARELTRRFLAKEICLLTQQHRGVTAAWNLGLSHVKTETAVLLNNDVVTQESWWPLLQRMLSKSPDSLVGAELRTEPVVKEIDLSLKSNVLAGWCLGFRMSTYETIGPFDETMALYWSDTDWQLRWRGEFSGSTAELKVLPDGLVRHRRHRTVRELKQERRAIWQQDRETFLLKWCANFSGLQSFGKRTENVDEK